MTYLEEVGEARRVIDACCDSPDLDLLGFLRK